MDGNGNSRSPLRIWCMSSLGVSDPELYKRKCEIPLLVFWPKSELNSWIKADRHDSLSLQSKWASVHPNRKQAMTKYDNVFLKKMLHWDSCHFCENSIETVFKNLSRHRASLPCRTQKKPSPPLVTFSTGSHWSQNTKYLLPYLWQMSNTWYKKWTQILNT